MSPSATKMGIAVPKANASKELDLEWLYKHFAKINMKQYEKMRVYVSEFAKKMGPILDQDFLKDRVGITNDMLHGKSMPMLPTKIKQFDKEQRFFTTQILAGMAGSGKEIFRQGINKLFDEHNGAVNGKKRTRKQQAKEK